MSRVYERYRRLESRQPFGNLERGFGAEIADPVWFLGRQWQMGEHQGEDASSPVEVYYALDQTALQPHNGDPNMDPLLTPPEAIVESEPGDWWTPGRRLHLGKRYANAANLPAVDTADPALLLQNLPLPYDRFNGKGYDGYRLFQTRPRDAVFKSVFAEVPTQEPDDLWDPAELAYSASFAADQFKLSLPRHEGGHIEWYAADVDGGPYKADPNAETRQVIPARMQYPGAPHPRWWQIENARVDIGGFPPDRAHFATMLLIDLIASHSDDWFTFPIPAQNGHLLHLREVVVKDSFDDEWRIDSPADWTIFALTGYQQAGLDPATLLLWPTVIAPLTGAIEEEVILGVDEDANLLWAVETRIHGRELATEIESNGSSNGASPNGELVDGSARRSYRYRPAAGLRPLWHPYPIQEVDGRRRFVQGRLADLSAGGGAFMPEPQARLLYDFANLAEDPAQQVGPVHQIEPAAVPAQGLRLQRRWMLARQSDGQPRLWMQRQRLPLLSPPISGLRFDLLEKIEA